MVKVTHCVRTRFSNLRWRCLDFADRLMFSPAREARLIAHVRSEILPPPDQGPKRLLVDLSVITNHDAGTGIQRVVRSLRDRLHEAVRQGVEIEHVVVRKLREGYVTTSGRELPNGSDILFLGLDFATDAVHRSRVQLRELRRSGTPIWFLVHDVLPMSHPQWFTYPSRLKYRRWMRICAALADGIFCFSPEVARELTDLIIVRYGRTNLPRIVVITPGSEIYQANKWTGIDQLPSAPGLNATNFANAVLIVGTLEPRKGHTDALAAFARLWRQGHNIPLVLIGRAGWDTAGLQAMIRQHEYYGHLLFWFDDVSDEALYAAYQYCRLTLVPSLAEGYGLPLDEALAIGSPVLARGIPVFRRHRRNDVRYFPENAGPQTLADCILAALEIGRHRPMCPLQGWDTTASQLALALDCNRK